MARIVCQVLHRADRITFIWSAGSAFFEPYQIDGNDAARLVELAARVQSCLVEGKPANVLGHQLYRELFRLDGAVPQAAVVHAWLSEQATAGKIQSVEFLTDVPGLIPWHALIDDPAGDASQFWGARFELAAGRRVNILRQNPVQFAPVQLMAADSDLMDALAEDQRAALAPLRTEKKLVHDCGALGDELTKLAPDVLLLLVRFEGGQLKLGGDVFSGVDLQGWLAEPRDGNPDPMIILMGCGDRAEQPAWQALVNDFSMRFGGLIANEVPTAPQRAFAVGHLFAQRFVAGAQTTGQVLRSLRQEIGGDALLFNAHCPPDLRVVKDAGAYTPAPPETELAPLPPAPYRPFAAYDEDSRALFVGREEDTLRGALLMDQATTRGILLHGAPASGKTSYLQAGLLPFLEQECVGYRGLRDRTPLETPAAEKDYPHLILRATSDLAGQFAAALTAFCAQPYVYTTPAGTQISVDLPRILGKSLMGGNVPAESSAPSTSIQAATDAGAITNQPDTQHTQAGSADLPPPEELWIELRDNPKLLAQVLDALTRALPFELVIAIDQGEDLITLARSTQQRDRRAKAIKMLMEIANTAARCKIIFATRSQSLAQLTSLMPNETAPRGWRTHYLPPLSESAMADALVRPTLREPIAYAAEVPSEKYRFVFEDGLAPQIVADAVEASASESQSPLSLLQAIGFLLYEKKSIAKQQNALRMQDVKDVGGVRQSLMNSLEHALEKLKLSSASTRALRQMIAKLFIANPDGTVNRDLVAAGDLKGLWTGTDAVEEVVNTAADKAGLFDIQELMIGGRSDIYVSVPQDSVAQLGRKIDNERELQAFGKTRIIDTLWIMIPFSFLCAVLAWAGTRYYAGETETPNPKENEEAAMERVREFYTSFARKPMYHGLIARADQAIRADNVLRARQILREEPASRNIHEQKPNDFPDLRNFEWRYLWKQLNGERYHLQGHRGAIAAVAVSRDGKRAATASARGDQKDDDASVRVWNLETGAELARIPGPKTAALSVAFAPDGKTLAIGYADKSIRLFDLANVKDDFVKIDKEAKTLSGHEGPVHALAFGSDDKTLISASGDKTVILWDVAAGKEKHTLKEHGAAVLALAVSGDGKTIASAGSEKQLIVWDADSGKKRQAIATPFREIATLAFSPDGKTIAAGGTEAKFDADVGTLRFFGASDGKETGNAITHASGIQAVAYRPDGAAIATGGKDFVIRLWNLKDAIEERKWIGHLGAITALAFAKETGALISGSVDAQVKVWNADQADVVRAHDAWVQCLALNPNNTLLASGARDGSVKLWFTATAKLALALPAHLGAVTSVAFSAHADKSFLAVATRDEKNEGAVKIWQIEGNSKEGYKSTEKHTLKGHKSGVNCVAFFPNDDKANILVSGGADGSVIVWDIAAGKETKTHKAHNGEVRCAAFFPDDGHIFATGGKDGNVRFFDIEHGDMWTLDNLHNNSIEAIAHLPKLGGKSGEIVHGLFTASADNSAALWQYVKDRPGAVQNSQLSPYRFHTQPVSGILYNAKDGNSVITSSGDRSIKIFDIFGNERHTFLGHTGAVRAIAMSQNLTFLASASNDGTIRFWRADPPRPTRPAPQQRKE